MNFLFRWIAFFFLGFFPLFYHKESTPPKALGVHKHVGPLCTCIYMRINGQRERESEKGHRTFNDVWHYISRDERQTLMYDRLTHISMKNSYIRQMARIRCRWFVVFFFAVVRGKGKSSLCVKRLMHDKYFAFESISNKQKEKLKIFRRNVIFDTFDTLFPLIENIHFNKFHFNFT